MPPQQENYSIEGYHLLKTALRGRDKEAKREGWGKWELQKKKKKNQNQRSKAKKLIHIR